MKDGALVADAQSAVADPATGEPRVRRHLVGSTAKGVLSSLVHALVAPVRLDYDLRRTEVWPEFATHDKGNVTVRHVLMHEAGVPGLPRAQTFGFLLGETRQRTTCASLVTLLREILTEPPAVIDELHFAVPVAGTGLRSAEQVAAAAAVAYTGRDQVMEM